MLRQVDYKSIPLLISKSGKRVEKAGVRAMNNLAFKIVPSLVSDATGVLKFSGNPKAALGWRIDKATPSRAIAVIETPRKWLAYHLDVGDRRATAGGWKYDGQDWIVVPVLRSAFRSRGKGILPGYLKNLYYVRKGDRVLVFYRLKRGEKGSQLIAVLKPQVAFHAEIKPQETINRIWHRDATKFFEAAIKGIRI